MSVLPDWDDIKDKLTVEQKKKFIDVYDEAIPNKNKKLNEAVRRVKSSSISDVDKQERKAKLYWNWYKTYFANSLKDEVEKFASDLLHGKSSGDTEDHPAPAAEAAKKLPTPQRDNYKDPMGDLMHWDDMSHIQQIEVMKVVESPSFRDLIDADTSKLSDKEKYELFARNLELKRGDEVLHEIVVTKVYAALNLVTLGDEKEGDSGMHSVASTPPPSGAAAAPEPEGQAGGGMFRALAQGAKNLAGRVKDALTKEGVSADSVEQLSPEEKWKRNVLGMEGFSDDAKDLDAFLAAKTKADFSNIDELIKAYPLWKGKQAEATKFQVQAKLGEDMKGDASFKNQSKKLELPSAAVGPYVKRQLLKEQSLFGKTKMSSVFTRPNYKIEPMKSKLSHVLAIQARKIQPYTPTISTAHKKDNTEKLFPPELPAKNIFNK